MKTCEEYVEERKALLKETIKSNNLSPTLCVVQIGDNPASDSYVRGKKKDCEEIGIEFKHVHIKDYSHVSEDDLINIIEDLNANATIDGIIVQLPIPDKYRVDRIVQHIDIFKDVDGFKPHSYFTPCTPKGIIDYLEYNNIGLEGKVCVVVGRSEIVGKPLVNLLIDKGATVVSCNSKTTNIRQFTENADIVISAIGKANYFDYTYFTKIPNRSILIDVGINRDEQGKLCGDIKESAKQSARLATPVPKGVGLLTRLALMENTIEATSWF